VQQTYLQGEKVFDGGGVQLNNGKIILRSDHNKQ
jgi:hypothetical protein